MNRRWLHAWLAALLLFAALAVGFEAFLRTHGYWPTVQDDRDLWSLQRERLFRNGGAIALLGSSRMQYAVDPATVEQHTGREAVMLAVIATYPIAALRALAEDPTFHGLAIVGIDSRGLSRAQWDTQQPWFDHYAKRWTFARKLHRLLLTPLQEHLALMRFRFAWAQMLRRQLRGAGLPINDYVHLRADRLGMIDYSRADVAAIRELRIRDVRKYPRGEPAAQWLQALEQVSQWVRTIQARGGQVVLFREPLNGEHLLLEETKYPRAEYWDAYARVAPMPLIDFRDEPAFAQIELPDMSHIEGRDVPRFTRVLLDALGRRGILAGHDAQAAAPATIAFANLGFEVPPLAGSYQYGPSGAAWTFSPSAGITGNGNAFTGGNPVAPEGMQAGFIQGPGRIGQRATLGAGQYVVSFRAAQRGGYQLGTQAIAVVVDGITVGQFSPPGTAYSPYQTPAFTVANSGAHALELVGIGSGGADFTAFIDSVQIGPP